MNPELVIQLIKNALPDAQVTLRSPDNVHFEAEVVSAAFVGKTLIQQHRLVNDAIKAELDSNAIHAMSLKTRTP